jgi:hypothetical protein
LTWSVRQGRIVRAPGGNLVLPLAGELIVIKRLVVAAFVTAVTAVGVAAPADAAPKHHGAGSAATQAIDWE